MKDICPKNIENKSLKQSENILDPCKQQCVATYRQSARLCVKLQNSEILTKVTTTRFAFEPHKN